MADEPVARSLTCGVCARTFARHEHLQRHSRTHTKEKPYACFCGRSFTRKDLLTRHERLHHSRGTKSSQRTAGVRSEPGIATRSAQLNGFSSPSQAPHALQGAQITPVSSTTMRRSVLNSQSPDFVWSGSLPNLRDQDAEDLVDSTSDIPTTYDDPILDFTRFMNVSELNIDWDQMILDSISNDPSAVNATTQEAQSVTPEMSDISSRIPDDDNDFQELKPVRCPWLFPASHRAGFLEALNPFLHILSDFHLPSRLSIARYLSGYVDGFSNHHPFIHVPTLRHLSFEHSPELYLAILCIGAQYRYETTTARHLYQSSRSIILERLRRGDFFCPKNPLPCDIDISKRSFSTFEWMHRVRALILLTIYASWQKEATLVQEAFEFQGLISRCVREVGLHEASDAPEENWLIWSRNETDRRTKFYAYCLLNLHSFAFDTPPLLLSRELNLYLPSSCKEWVARNQAEWIASRPRSPIPAMFKSVHGSHLAIDDDLDPRPDVSPMGNYILIHSILQRIYLMQQLSQDPHRHSLASRDIAEFEQALNRWRHTWRMSPESTLDLHNPYGSLSFTSTALLGAAHIRLHCNFAQWRDLQSCDPSTIAATLHEAPPPQRGAHLIYALLHSVHALNIPVQLGISYLSHCKSFSWSVYHALCDLECAAFLGKWLIAISSSHLSVPLSLLEQRVIRWISRVVREALLSHDETISLGLEVASLDLTNFQTATRKLAHAVVKVWAQMFKHCNSPWPIMSIVGHSLDRYADLISPALNQMESLPVVR